MSPYFCADSTSRGSRLRRNCHIMCPGKRARGPGASVLVATFHAGWERACCGGCVGMFPTSLQPPHGCTAHERTDSYCCGHITRPVLVLVDTIPSDECD